MLAEPEWAALLTPVDRRGLTPLFWLHVRPYGEVRLDLNAKHRRPRLVGNRHVTSRQVYWSVGSLATASSRSPWVGRVYRRVVSASGEIWSGIRRR
ncbi:hypothetical protein [Nonomuraea aurantiaca]|uniref:hypothetical protein n=1 Tax=Nonomuraea aurantiaca TaxID=2878562 RepID=UPI001CD9B4B1|nr:hypothetical protein [Nonomuraea aurantiaca]MCA2229591.1 hypothetical protein [Nonomuraea aurantiaca]